MKEQYDIIKSKKIFKLNIPCGMVVAIITFVLLIIFEDFSNIPISILLSGTCSATRGIIVLCTPVIFLNMYDDFFIKRYSDIKEFYNKIKNIENDIKLSEINFNKMKVDRDTLRTTIKFRDA